MAVPIVGGNSLTPGTIITTGGIGGEITLALDDSPVVAVSLVLPLIPEPVVPVDASEDDADSDREATNVPTLALESPGDAVSDCEAAKTLPLVTKSPAVAVSDCETENAAELAAESPDDAVSVRALAKPADDAWESEIADDSGVEATKTAAL